MLVRFRREALDGISRLRIEVWRRHLEVLGVILQDRGGLGWWELLKPNILRLTPIPEASVAARCPHVLHPPDLPIRRDQVASPTLDVDVDGG